MPEDIAVKWVVEQESNFNARFSANYRHYQYVLLTKSSILRTNNALFGNHMVSLESNLDVEKMHKAAQCLIEHDFSAFRSSGCQAHSPVRRMYGLSVKRYSDFIVVDVMANAFLYNMVRNIVGALCEVGSGNKPKDWLKVILEGKNRDVGYKKMPAHGLYLVGVGYNDFPEVDRLSHYNKIMLTSGHLPLVFSDRLLKNKDKIIESV